MVEVHFYGKLRRYADNINTAKGYVTSISPHADETVESLLAHVGVPAEEIYSIFLNGKLLAARSGMARWIGYQQIRGNPFDWNLNVPVRPGDRIGLFGRDMAALVI